MPSTIVANATAAVAANPTGGAPCRVTPSTVPILLANVSCPIALWIIHVARSSLAAIVVPTNAAALPDTNTNVNTYFTS